MNQCRLFGFIAVAGVLCTIFGALKKVLHQLHADLFLTIGMFAEGIGLAALTWFLYKGMRR